MLRQIVRLYPGLVWLVFLLWLLVQLPTFVRLEQQGRRPIDFLAYDQAADAIERGRSPYLTRDETLQIWRYFHQNEQDVLAADARGEGQATLREIEARPPRPGPYLYPPTLALLVSQLRISGLVFGCLTLVSIFGFAWLWLRSTGANPIWLVFIMLSFDVLAALNGGNVELLLLFFSLLAARLLWDRRPWLAAPLIAFVVLTKPFYALMFVSLALLQLLSDRASATLRSLGLAVAATLVLVGVEVVRWGERLRTETFHYLRNALDYQWFVLPPVEQTPMSAWNRTPMQVLVGSGMMSELAQWLSLLLWALLLAATVWRVRRLEITFPLAFALSLILLYLGRPVGWGLVYLEVVLGIVSWQRLNNRQRPFLIAAAIALMVSHWWALVLTAQGHGMPLVTLQRADLPWETMLVLPLGWLLLLKVAPASPALAPAGN